mgnify:CR=1 FL=1
MGLPRKPSVDRTEPVSRRFGYDRGTPIDRYYIENFLARQAGVERVLTDFLPVLDSIALAKQHDDVAGPAAGAHAGDFLRDADGDGVDPQLDRARGEQLQPEAVAVALRHSDEAGDLREERALMRVPAGAVDGEREGHGHRRFR